MAKKKDKHKQHAEAQALSAVAGGPSSRTGNAKG